MSAIDIAIVGGGIVGLAVACELQRRRSTARIVLLEREPEIARHQSGHNSGVIHGGIYYAPGSLKARLCVAGSARMYDFCERNGIATERCGKLIVALDRRELPGLSELERRGHANGVPGLRRLDHRQLRTVEPNAVGIAALYAPQTGIVDFAAVAAALRDQFLAAGGTLRLRTEVTAIADSGRDVQIALADGDRLAARYLLGCAGGQSDRLAVAAGAPPDPRIVPFRGAYLRLRRERTNLVSTLIYPVPDPSLPFLGVHLTPQINGDLVIGPTALLAAGRGGWAGIRTLARDITATALWPGTARMAIAQRRAAAIELRHAICRRDLVRSAARYAPTLSYDDIDRRGGWAGIRAQAVGRDGSLVDDFVFSATARTLHVRNAPSPAATSSLAIAEHVADSFERAFS